MDHNENEIPDDFSNESEENSEEIEKKFEPLEEMDVLDEVFNTFEPREENDENPYIFETEFMPKDETNAGGDVKKKLDKEKEKKLNLQPKKIKKKEISGRVKGKTQQELLNEGNIKECRRCHEFKSINDFEKYMRSRKKAYCRPCRLEYKQVRALQNKTNIIRNINGGKYAEKCPECNITIAKLPAFDFHHPIKELKTKEINFHGNWEKTLSKLEQEKVIPSCRNCHLKKQPKYYSKYKELIENRNDFESSIKGIEKKLYQLIYSQFPDKGHKEGYQIKSWISKRIVIERLYNGNCIGCGEKDLQALQFHHRDITKKTFQKYDKLRYTTVEKIEKKLIQDDVVCLCGNCHRMTESYYFEKNHQEIVGTKYNREITTYYRNLKNNIKNFKFPANILKQHPLIKTEKVEIGWKPRSYNLTREEERIKEEIRSINWNAFSQNWNLPTGEVLNPNIKSSQTNPLYKHKAWLEYVYNNIEWGLSDKRIARITNTSLTTINYWRKKLRINTK